MTAYRRLMNASWICNGACWTLLGVNCATFEPGSREPGNLVFCLAGAFLGGAAFALARAAVAARRQAEKPWMNEL